MARVAELASGLRRIAGGRSEYGRGLVIGRRIIKCERNAFTVGATRVPIKQIGKRVGSNPASRHQVIML